MTNSSKVQPKTLPEPPQTVVESKKERKPWLTPRDLPTSRAYYTSTEVLVKEVSSLLAKVDKEFSYEKSISASQPKHTLGMKKRAVESCGESLAQSIETHDVKYMKCIAAADKLKLHFEQLIYSIEQKENRAYKSIYDIETFYMKDLAQYVFKVLPKSQDGKGTEGNEETKTEPKVELKKEVDLDILVSHKDSTKEFIESLKAPLKSLLNLAVAKDLLEPNLDIFKKNNDVDGAALHLSANQKDLDEKIEAGKQAVKVVQELEKALDIKIPNALSEIKPRYELEKTQLGVIREWIETRKKEVEACIKEFEKYVKGIDVKGIKEKPGFFPIDDQKILTDLISKTEKGDIIAFEVEEKKDTSKINELLPLATKAKELAKMVFELAKKNGVNSISESVYADLQNNFSLLNKKYDESLKRTNQIRLCYEQILSYICLVNEDLKAIKKMGEQITSIQSQRKLWGESKTEEYKEPNRKVIPDYGWFGAYGKK